MKRLVPIVALLASCSPFSEHFEPGVAGKLDFELSNGFWADRFEPSTPIAAGGYVALEAQGDDPARAFVAVSSDTSVIEVIAADPIVPARTPGGLTWRCPLRAGNPGRARIEMRDAAGLVDAVDLTVVAPASIDWQVYDPDRAKRRDGDILAVRPAEQLEISVWTYAADGKRLAGTDAVTLEAGTTTLLAEPAPDTPQAATWEVEHIGAWAPVNITGKAFGTTELIVRCRGGVPERRILLKVDVVGE